MAARDEQTHIRLSIRGKDLDWRYVSEILGCKPTAHFSRGDEFENASGTHARDFGLWALDTTAFVGSDDLADHARELVARITPEAIGEFIRDPAVSVQLYLWWVGDEGTLGFGIRSDLLRDLCGISNEINASFVKLDAQCMVEPAHQQQSGEAGGRSIDNPSSLEGATPEEVESAAEEAGFTDTAPLRDGNGVRLSNPDAPGRSVQINKGYPGGGGVHGGPYVKITGNGPTVRIPLAGNPTLP